MIRDTIRKLFKAVCVFVWQYSVSQQWKNIVEQPKPPNYIFSIKSILHPKLLN